MMPTADEPRTIAIHATDTIADWEFAYLTAEVARAERQRPGRFRLVFTGDGLAPVTTMGGIAIDPTLDVAELVELDGLAMLVVPGGDTWFSGHERLIGSVHALLERDRPVAAICGATWLMARIGVLDSRRHTSNAADFLAASGYAGGDHYVDAPVVTDGGLTTGSGVRPVQFTAEVLRVAGVLPESVIAPWERLNTTGGLPDYLELTKAQDAFAAA